jgi:hypothetical protein
MNLDGSPVLVGDLIFDILLGITGSITEVGPGTFKVQFSPVRTLTYAGNGEVAGAKRAYWLNPVLTAPKKADPQWTLLRDVVSAIRANPCQ